MLFATCIGGNGRDTGRNVALDSSGNLYLTGWTTANDFPTTPGVVQTGSGGGTDGWVAKLNADATTILFSTYLGGSGYDVLEGLVVDSSDNVIVSGRSESSADYPLSLAVQSTFGGGDGDGVISKLNPTGTAFLFSTYFGGNGDDFAWGLKIDADDRIYFTGYTSSTNFPTVNAIDATLGGDLDSYVSQLSADGQTIEFSTYLGGSGSDNSSNGLHVVGPGEMVVVRGTDSTDFFVTPDAFQSTNVGLGDAFITRLSTPIEIPADDCTFTAAGCNPTGGQEIILPENFVVPAGGTITQTPTFFVDPRADEFGRCDGTTELVLFDDDPLIPDLVIPKHLCGSPEFEVLVTEANFDIEEGTILTTMFPEAFVNNPFDCSLPIIGDPQLQDVVVWQPTDRFDVIEGRALELTFDCGSSRGRIRGLSYFMVGLHIEFGLPFTSPSEVSDVGQAFVDLTDEKIAGLIHAVWKSRHSVNRHDFIKQFVKAWSAKWNFRKGRYQRASRKLETLLSIAERASFDVDDINHQGNIISRAENIKFTINEKIIPIVN